MFSRRRLGLVLASVGFLALGLGLAWRVWQSIHSRPAQARRIAILTIDNQTGDPGLNWAGSALREAALLELGQQVSLGDELSTVFPVRDAGDASARPATHLVYGRLEPGPHSGSIEYSFSLEEVAHRAVLRRVRGSGTVLKAASALASVVAAEAGISSLRPAGAGNDRALEFCSTRKYADCTRADPQAFWCWERWATSTFEAGNKDEALSLLARGRQQCATASAFAQARLELVEASIRGDEPMRLDALEKLVKVDSSSPAAVAELAAALMTSRKYPQAESLYRTALRRDADQPELWNMLAYAQAGQSRFDDARKSLAEYARLSPTGPNPPDSRGEIEWMAGNLAGASTWFLDSYKRDANFNAGVALEKAALSRYLAGDVRGAEELANRFLTDRDRAGDVLATFHRARWQFLWGNFEGGEALLETLVERGGPDAAIAASRLLLVSLRNDDLPAAKKWARAVQQVSPKTANPLLSRLAAALVDGDEKAISDPSLRAELSAVRLTLRGDFTPAVSAWDEATRDQRGASDSFDREMKAWCLVRAGRTTEAANLVRVGWPLLDSDDRLLFDFLVYPNLLFVRAEAAAARGDSAEARRLYDVYLRYAGNRKDRFGQFEKARAASRL